MRTDGKMISYKKKEGYITLKNIMGEWKSL